MHHADYKHHDQHHDQHYDQHRDHHHGHGSHGEHAHGEHHVHFGDQHGEHHGDHHGEHHGKHQHSPREALAHAREENKTLHAASNRVERMRRAEMSMRPYYDSIVCNEPLPEALPRYGMAARHVKSMIQDQHALDSMEKLNTSSYVTVVQEPEEEDVALMGLKVNLADQTVYPQSFEVHNLCVRSIAKLWHAPKTNVGAGTVGSTEACLLAAVALKFRWRAWYARRLGAAGVDDERVRVAYPNLVVSTMFQAAWEKFFKYFDVEPRFVVPEFEDPSGNGRGWRLDPNRLDEAIDERTIGVVCIMGSHYSGHYDDVASVDAKVREINKDRGFQIGIHVDAASGGFVAPFQHEVGTWDFRLPSVLSISASGHKFGQSCCGTGWVVWRDRADLAEHVAISVGYLGGVADSFTLNFSRPATGVYVQYYKFLRLGLEGYDRSVKNMMAVAHLIREGLKKMTRVSDGKKYFEILDAGKSGCLPVVSARLDPALRLPYDDIDLQHAIAVEHWYVSGYKLSFEEPITHDLRPLFSDMDMDATMFRVVVKANLSAPMASHLLKAVHAALVFLEAHEGGYKKHPHHEYRHGHKVC